MRLDKVCVLTFILMVHSPFANSEADKNLTCDCHMPVFLLHGIRSDSYHTLQIEEWIKEAHPGTIVFNSNAYPDLLSFTPCWDQIRGKLGRMFREFSDKHPCGIICIGHSQGALLMRGLIEDYPDHNVHTFISLAGPQAGQYGFPEEHVVLLGSLLQTSALRTLASDVLYTSEIQSMFSISNYWRDPHRLDDYYKYCVYLPYIDNEVRSDRSEDYKRAFEKLKFFVAVAGPDDGVIMPWQSGHCGFYDENEKVIPYHERDVCTKDLYGLCTLDKDGRFIRHTRDGVQHGGFLVNRSIFDETILPYLGGHPHHCSSATTDIIDVL